MATRFRRPDPSSAQVQNLILNLTKDHYLTRMVKEGALQMKFHDPNHPDQAYRAGRRPEPSFPANLPRLKSPEIQGFQGFFGGEWGIRCAPHEGLRTQCVLRFSYLRALL